MLCAGAPAPHITRIIFSRHSLRLSAVSIFAVLRRQVGRCFSAIIQLLPLMFIVLFRVVCALAVLRALLRFFMLPAVILLAVLAQAGHPLKRPPRHCCARLVRHALSVSGAYAPCGYTPRRARSGGPPAKAAAPPLLRAPRQTCFLSFRCIYFDIYNT